MAQSKNGQRLDLVRGTGVLKKAFKPLDYGAKARHSELAILSSSRQDSMLSGSADSVLATGRIP